MRPAPLPRSTYTVSFGGKPCPREEPQRETCLPRVTRLLVLAHQIDRMILASELRNLADAARTIGVTRARITQITNLLLLAPEIQEAILGLPAVTEGRDLVTERQLRAIVAEADWRRQVRLWRGVVSRGTRQR